MNKDLFPLMLYTIRVWEAINTQRKLQAHSSLDFQSISLRDQTTLFQMIANGYCNNIPYQATGILIAESYQA